MPDTNISIRQRVPGLFGCRPVPYGHHWQLQMSAYVDLKALPPIPSGAFGHTSEVTKPWEIYLNDSLGDCVVAGKQHCLRLWLAEGTGSDTIVFDDATTVRNYELLGHYNPDNPDSDQGCDMLYAAAKWITHGIWDASGKLHKIGSALELQCGDGYLNMDQFWYACYLFDGVGLGILVTPEMQDAFAEEKPWDVSQFNMNNVVGGHFVPAMARVNDNGQLEPQVITWGEPQGITIPGLQAITTTVLVYLSPEKLKNGKDEEGLGYSDLRADMRQLNKVGSLRGIHRL
jgi:hypothetical protein